MDRTANLRRELIGALDFLQEYRGDFFRCGHAVEFDAKVSDMMRELAKPIRHCDQFDSGRDGRVAAFREFTRRHSGMDARLTLTDAAAMQYVLAHVFEFLEWFVNAADSASELAENEFHSVKVTDRGKVNVVRDLPLEGKWNRDGDAYRVSDHPQSIYVWIGGAFREFAAGTEFVTWRDGHCEGEEGNPMLYMMSVDANVYGAVMPWRIERKEDGPECVLGTIRSIV